MAWYYRRTDELYHHGILGQKWGVRRFQNKDGSLTKAGLRRQQKEEKKKQKENSKKQTEKAYEMMGKAYDYGEEYDKTPDGKLKLKAYQKEIKNMETDPDWDDNEDAQERLYKIEEDYLRSKQRYEAEKLVSEYGALEASTLWNKWGYSRRGDITDDAKTFIKQYEDEWYIHAL